MPAAMLRLCAICVAAALLGACSDTRRDAVRGHIESTVPGNMSLVRIDETYRFEQAGARWETQVLVEYDTILPTVRKVDAATLPEWNALRRRVAELRGWALSEMPKEDPAQTAILDAAAEATEGFTFKRTITPAGTRIPAVVTLELEIEGTGWRVAKSENTARLPGEPDQWPDLPLENSPEMQARFSELSLLAEEMERMRDRFLERREKTAAETRAAMTQALATGNTFDGAAVGSGGGKVPVRFVISRGLDLGGTVVATLATETEPRRSAQFTGGLRQRGTGEFYLEAVRSQVLSGAGEFPGENGPRPALRLFLAKGGLEGVVEGAEPRKLALSPGERVEVIPETDPALESGNLPAN